MNRGYDYRKHAVLYVDDERQSLKYFCKAFDKDFTVLTAPSAKQAREILEQDRDGAEVGVLVVDQRMPEETGVEFLRGVRRSRPDTVRILTTAYSDLDSAIEAVNSGAIFRYVTKPWDIRDLRGILLRAMEFFLVQRERDILLREKLSVLQRLIVTDRVRCLAVMAAGLAHHIRNSMSALMTFLNQAPDRLQEELRGLETVKSPEFWQDLWSLAQKESRRILQIVEDVTGLVTEPTYRFGDVVSVPDLVGPGLARSRAEAEGVSVGVDAAPGLPDLKVDKAMAERLFEILLCRMVRMSRPGGVVTVRASGPVQLWGTSGVKISITGDGPAWTEDLAASLFTVFAPAPYDPRDLGLDVLSAYFIAYHHGGDIAVQKAPPDGPGFEVVLPFDPEAAQCPPFENDFVDKVFTLYEEWDSFRDER